MREGLRRWLGVVAMLGVPLAILVVLRIAVELDARFFTPMSHLVVIALISACATTIALVAAVSARRATHPGLAHLSVGTAGVGILMMGHGLTTPGVITDGFNPWVGRFPHLALSLFAVTIFLAGRRVDTPFARLIARKSGSYVAVSVVSLSLLTGAAVRNPSWASAPGWEATATDLASAAAVVLALGVTIRHWQRWHLGHDRVQLALTFAAAMTVAAVTSLEFGRFQQLSWWDYHAYLLAGFGGAVYAVWSRAREYRQIDSALASAFSDDAIAHITDGYPAALLQMVKAVELKDTYTHGHSQRTAHVAAELGLRMGLPPERLRVVARGAYLHDLGKIGIPDHILNKAGRLDPDEFEIIKTHPQLGWEMAATAPSLREALDVILRHHERYDGTGYPGGLAGDDIPLAARIVAVADVWDALTSDRAYRPGWAPSRALAHIVSGRGTHFDPVVVDAMVDLAADWGITVDGEAGDAEVAREAAETCHQASEDSDLVGV